MKKSLSIILSLMIVITTISVAFVFPTLAANTYDFNENFESYSDGENIITEIGKTDTIGGQYVGGLHLEPNSKGFVAAPGNGNEFFKAKKLSDGNTVMHQTQHWGGWAHVATVKPNTNYVLTFKVMSDAEVYFNNIGVMDITGKDFKVPMHQYGAGGPMDTATWITPRANTDYLYNGTGWKEYSVSFTTSAATTEISVFFGAVGWSSATYVYYDDFNLSEASYSIAEDFESYKDGEKVLNELGRMGNYNGTDLKGINLRPNVKGFVSGPNVAGNFSVKQLSDGNKVLAQSAGWGTWGHLISVKPNKQYEISFRVFNQAESRTASIGVYEVDQINHVPMHQYGAGGAIDSAEWLAAKTLNYCSSENAGKWRDVTVTFKTDADTKLVNLFFYGEGWEGTSNTYIYYDDFSISELTGTLQDGTFESIKTGYGLGGNDNIAWIGEQNGFLAKPNGHGFIHSNKFNSIKVTDKKAHSGTKSLLYYDKVWASMGILFDAKPSTNYTLSFWYYTEAGNVINNLYVRDTTSLNNEFPFVSHTVYSSTDYVGEYLNSLNISETKTVAGKWTKVEIDFTTNSATKQIGFFNDGEKRGSTTDIGVYFDDFVLTENTAKTYVTPTSNNGSLGGTYPEKVAIPEGKSDVNVTFLATPIGDNTFVKWTLNGQDAGTDLVYKGKLNASSNLQAVFAQKGYNVANAGAEGVANGTDLQDQANTPSTAGKWFIVDEKGSGLGLTPNTQKGHIDNQTGVYASSLEAKSGTNSFDVNSLVNVYYYTIGRDITGLEKNTSYRISLWTKMENGLSLDHLNVIPKALKDSQWQNGTASDTDLESYDFVNKALANLPSQKIIADSSINSWQKIVLDFNTKDNTDVTITLKYKRNGSSIPAEKIYVDDIGIEKLDTNATYYNIKTTYGIGGKAVTTAGNGTVKAGTAVMFKAFPEEGYTFKGWYNGTQLVSTEENYIATVTGNIELEAKYNYVEIGLGTVSLGGSASVDKKGYYPLGTTATFTATKLVGNTFKGWFDYETGALVSTLETFVTACNTNTILNAVFEGPNKPAKELLGFNGFEDLALGYDLKNQDLPNYKFTSTSANWDSSFTRFVITNQRVFEGNQALLCDSRHRTNHITMKNLNRDTNYVIKFNYKMNESDEDELLADIAITPPGHIQGDSATELHIKYRAKAGKGGRGWDYYEIYFNSGNYTELDFLFNFTASEPNKYNPEQSPYGYDQHILYFDNFELWEYAGTESVVNPNFNTNADGWGYESGSLNVENKAGAIGQNTTIYQTILTQPLTQYVLTFKAKGQLDAAVLDLSKTSITNKNLLSSISATQISNTEFKEYKVAFTTGHDEAVNIAFRNTGTANALIDDVSVTLDTEGLSQGVIELVDFETDRFELNNFKKDPIVNTNNSEEPDQIEGFEIYTATSANDPNVKSGKKSLKIKAQADEEVQHKFWQAYTCFPVTPGGNYRVTISYKFDNPEGAAVYLAGDGTGIVKVSTDFAAEDNQWHEAIFDMSVDFRSSYNFIKTVVGTIVGSAKSDVYIDNIKFQLAPVYVSEENTRYTYTENLYNFVKNNSFEDNSYWTGLPSEYKIVKAADAFTQDKYLKAGKSSKTYVKVIDVEAGADLYAAVSIRGTKGSKSFVGITSDLNGKNFILNKDNEVASKFYYTKEDGEWQRVGIRFFAPSSGKVALVINTQDGALDVDNVMIFKSTYNFHYDPNDYFKYVPYDYTDMSNVIINGGKGKQPYYTGDLNVGRSEDIYEAKTTMGLYNPKAIENNVVKTLIILLSAISSCAAVYALIVKSKKEKEAK